MSSSPSASCRRGSRKFVTIDERPIAIFNAETVKVAVESDYVVVDL